jgi:hypothetical protein
MTKAVAKKNQAPAPQLPAVRDQKAEAIEKVLINGDLSDFTPELRIEYYNRLCASLGLNPLTRPFEFTKFQGKLVLYARKDCAEQLRKINGISIYKLETAREGEFIKARAYAKDATGREDIATGVLWVGDLRGQDLANAEMKAETKAKRRVTLSISGLGILDETDLEDADSPRAEPKEVKVQVPTVTSAASTDQTQTPQPEAKPAPAPEPPKVDPAPAPAPKAPDPDPAAGASVRDPNAGEYKFRFGKYLGTRLSEVPEEDLRSYRDFLARSERPSPLGREAMERIGKYLGL